MYIVQRGELLAGRREQVVEVDVPRDRVRRYCGTVVRFDIQP
jgi:hypothetical protein